MGFLGRTTAALSLLASIAAAKHYDVTVGKNGQLRFDPETLVAEIGDTITYNYFARNHSVTQSSFEKPCQPEAGGFFSGFVPTESPDVASRTTFTITVKDSKPIWVYCSQTNGNHCQSGMVHAINAPSQGNTFAKFKDLAAIAPTSTSPPDGLPVGGIRKLHVDVGLNGTLTYSPNNITELPRTVVSFSFNPRNHTVTQSSFDKPCFPLPNNSGFSSGFIATTQSPSGATFEIVIPDTKPIWFYCGQVNGNHCQAGMVGSINAPVVGNTLEAFIAKAKVAPPPSVIPPIAPLGGKVFVKGKEILKFNLNGGNAIDVDQILGIAPPPVTVSGTIYPPMGTGKPSTLVTVTRPNTATYTTKTETVTTKPYYTYGGEGEYKPTATATYSKGWGKGGDEACDEEGSGSGEWSGEWKSKSWEKGY
ncbi:Cupredoxin [Cercophora newfieldiana]|uniref:Cupredoxin n=1 Tax=Cercophora newfieldiana TaxID=92897 RepID=A0AA39Y0R2_9PEZI|nr:Cupredoxin [Cercophora newfieldiana]